MVQKNNNSAPFKYAETLKNQGCTAEDWSRVYITDEFDPELVSHVHFKGTVKIGRLTDQGTDEADQNTGLHNVTLENVEIGDDCFISDVHSGIKNMKIGSYVKIANVGTLACNKKSTFGNGHSIDVLNEAGGRELKITARTNSQMAYLSVFYRHDQNLIKKLDKMADDYTDKMMNTVATIGDHVTIENSRSIINVNIGSGARIINVTSLKNGTIDSSPEAPTLIENDVIADNFIVQKGASIKDGSLISSTLIGEASKIGKQFSSENSVLFANSEGFHSEVCSLFGGPYTVTHHRSTLLIANYCSFYNAGSGTNQSNHMYKLGPVHQGLMERGCKTGSFSYLLWPSRIGAFSVVLGKHYATFDSQDIPFSYINEESGNSFMFPGYNIFTVGTYRDGNKWRKRDRRTNSDKLDFIIFDIFSPYTANRIMKGIEIISEMQEKSDRKQQYLLHNGLRIKRLLLNSCLKHYRLALDQYFGSLVLYKIMNSNEKSLQKKLLPSQSTDTINEDWLDIGGLLCRRDRLDMLLDNIHAGKIDSLDKLHNAFENIHNSYKEDEWDWYSIIYRKMTGKNIWEEDAETISGILEKWKNASLKINNLIIQDAKREYDKKTLISYGIDGHTEDDFKAVRGDFEHNSVIEQIQNENQDIEKEFEKVKSYL